MKRAKMAAALLCAAMGWSGGAHAQAVDDAARGAARQLGEEGIALMGAGNWAAAYEKFDKALGLVQAPTLAVRAARCLEKMGRLVEASERYQAALGMPPDPGAPKAFRDAQVEAQGQARQEREALLPRIPTVEIVLEGATAAEAKVTLDGKALPAGLVGVKVPVNPGKHRLEARRGADVVAQEAVLAEGKTSRAVLRLPPLPPGATAPPVAPAGPAGPASGTGAPGSDSGSRPAPAGGSTQRAIGWVAIGLGGAGLGLGGAMYFVAKGKANDLDKKCPGGTCPLEESGSVDGYNSSRTISTVGLVAGGALAATGAVLLLTAPSGGGGTAGAGVRPWIGAGAAGVTGRF